MKNKVLQQLARLEAKKLELFEALEGYTPEALNHQPGEGKWSALQVMYHLFLAEGYAGNYVKKKLGFKPNLKKAGLRAAVRSRLLSLYLNSPIKWKAPKAVSTEKLPEHSDLETIAERWNKQRGELQQLLISLPETIFNKEVYKHPIVGRITLSGMLDFFEDHFDRHQKQIQRTLAQTQK